MFKNFKIQGWHVFLVVLLVAVVLIWKGCQPEPGPTIVVPQLTPPASVTSVPTTEEVELMKQFQEREQKRRRHD